METEHSGKTCFRVEFDGEEAAIFEELNARERRTKFYTKVPPVSAVRKGGGHASRRVSEKTDRRHAGQQARFPQNEIGMKVADNSALNLIEAAVNDFVTPKKWQRGGIVTEQEHFLAGFQRGKRAANVSEVFFPMALPFGAVSGQGIVFVNGKRDERGGHAQKNVVAEFCLPKRLQAEFVLGASPASELHAAASAEEAEFAQFVIAEGRVEVR